MQNEGIAMTSENGQPGQYFEDFLKERGTFECATEQAARRVLAYQLSEDKKTQENSKSETSRRMQANQSET